jgi:hypothetical protein
MLDRYLRADADDVGARGYPVLLIFYITDATDLFFAGGWPS